MNKPVLTINEVAEHYSVSVSTIREWVRKGYIEKNAYFKIGNVLRFRADEFDKCLNQVNISEDVIDVTPEQMMDNISDEIDEEDPKLSEAQKNLAKRLGLPLNEDEEDDELDLLDNDK